MNLYFYIQKEMEISEKIWICIRLSEKFLSFSKEIIDAQCSLFYISLLNYART